MLGHLIDNAIKFSDSGTITIDFHRHGDMLQLVVTDEGRGIDEHFIPHMFNDFKQESTGFSRGYEGNGLGLFIVGGFAELMGGTVQVHSEVGNGTQVRITLPTVVGAADSIPTLQRGDGHSTSPDLLRGLSVRV
jgi:signal transduction histidine kinase